MAHRSFESPLYEEEDHFTDAEISKEVAEHAVSWYQVKIVEYHF